jgi:hypothetical protein
MTRSGARSWIVTAMVIMAALFVARCSSGSSSASGAPSTEAVVASLRLKSIPGIPTALTPEKAAEISKWRATPGAWFVDNGCFGCHSVSVYGIKSEIGMGPDLAEAVQDVQSRFGMPLEKFMQEPTGTMQMVFSQMIVLSPEEKAVALQKLQEANREFLKKKSGS